MALAVQSFLPLPTDPGLINNYIPVWSSKIRDSIPAIKIDHLMSSNLKVQATGRWRISRRPVRPPMRTATVYPGPATAARGDYITANTTRISLDQTISPTLLLHLGIGYVNTNFNDQTAVTNFNDVTQLGLKGIPQPEGRFPYFTGLSSTNNTGGFAGAGNTNIGPLAQAQIFERRPTANASITWVKENHTYKAGADLIVDGFPTTVLGAAGVGTFNFRQCETAPPITFGSALARDNSVSLMPVSCWVWSITETSACRRRATWATMPLLCSCRIRGRSRANSHSTMASAGTIRTI